MAEARRPFIDPHAVSYKPVVERPRNAVNQPLVRNARRDDPHIHAPLCRKTERVHHFVRDNQIRRNVIDITVRFIRHRDIYFFTDMLIIHRTVRVRLNEAGFLRLIRIFRQVMQEVDIVFIAVFHGIPHLEECNRKTPHRVAFDADAGVFPDAVRMRHVEIFICEIISAGKTDPAVNNRKLSVIPVVQKNIKSRHKRIEDAALNTFRLQMFCERCRHKADAAHIIIEHADFNARLDAFNQNILNPFPGFRILDRVIFHENEAFRFRKILQLRLESPGGLIIINDIRIGIDRVMGVSPEIVRGGGFIRRLPVQLLRHFPVFRQERKQHAVDVFIASAHLTRGIVQADQEIQGKSNDRKNKNQNDPRHLHR